MSAARQSNVEEILSELNRRPIDFKDPNDCLLPDIAPGTTRKQAGLLSESPIEHGFKQGSRMRGRRTSQTTRLENAASLTDRVMCAGYPVPYSLRAIFFTLHGEENPTRSTADVYAKFQ
jgi:hypothetical protein